MVRSFQRPTAFTPATLICLAALVPAAAAAGSGDAIVTDSPAFVASARTIDERCFQVETSVQRVADGSDASLFRSWTTPTLIRFGLDHQLEMRLQSAAASHVRFASDVTNGVSDVSVGIKGVVPHDFDPEMSVAWIAEALLPSGSKAIKGNSVRPAVRLAADWSLPHQTSFGVMPGIGAERDATGDWFPSGLLGVNVAYAWSARVSSFAEATDRSIRRDTRGGNNLVWDVGTAWRLRPDTQLSACVGFGAKDNDTDRIWSVGLSRRFTPRVPGTYGSRTTSPAVGPSASTGHEQD